MTAVGGDPQDSVLSAESTSPPRASPTLSTLLTLAWPVVLARATQAVIGFSDALLVAPLGEAPLAAVTTGALDAYAVLILPLGIVFIVQSFAAQLRGRGELEAVRRYAWYGLAVALGTAILGALAIPLVPVFVRSLGYAPDVAHDMTVYISIRLLSVGGAVGAEALSNWYGGLGNTRIGMIASVVAMVTNVLGCLLLIQPRFGLPGFGVVGAGIASVLASWLGFAVVLTLFVKRAGLEGLRFEGPVGKLRVRELLRVLRFGAPNGVNWFLEFAAFILFINVVVGHLGTTVLAAFNVVMQINSLGFMPAFGLSSAGAILVGEAIGRRALGDVWPIVRLTAAVAVAWMLFVGVLYFALPAPLVGLFQPGGGGGDELVRVGTKMLAIAALWQLFDALGMVLGEALRAAGDTTWCMGARIVLAWLVFTPAAWVAVLVLHGGVGTVMGALVAYLAMIATALALRFASGRWKQIDMVGEPKVI